MRAGLFGLNLSSALQKNARDDLQAIGHPMLNLLQEYRLVPQQVVLHLLGNPRVRDVGHRQKQPDRRVRIVKLMSIENQTPGILGGALQIHLVTMHIRDSGRRCLQQDR